jgi:hypothetical protein
MRNFMATLLVSQGVPMLLLNSSDRLIGFTLPPVARGRPWRLVLDTARPRKTGRASSFWRMVVTRRSHARW